MPNETLNAINWALGQEFDWGDGITVTVTKNAPHELVTLVSRYFYDNNIQNSGFSHADLMPYL